MGLEPGEQADSYPNSFYNIYFYLFIWLHWVLTPRLGEGES